MTEHGIYDHDEIEWGERWEGHAKGEIWFTCSCGEDEVIRFVYEPYETPQIRTTTKTTRHLSDEVQIETIRAMIDEEEAELAGYGRHYHEG